MNLIENVIEDNVRNVIYIEAIEYIDNVNCGITSFGYQLFMQMSF